MIIGKSDLEVGKYFDTDGDIEFSINSLHINDGTTYLTKDEVKTLIEHLTNVLEVNKEH